MKTDLSPLADSTSPSIDSAPVPGPSGQPPRRIEVSEKDAAEPAEFDRVLAGIASRLSNVTDEKFDETVTGCLRTLVEFLDFDCSSLMAFSEHGSRFQVTHSWAVGGVPPAPSDVLLNAQIPWFTRQIRSGHVVSVSGSIDLPVMAAAERVYLLKSGLKSILATPLLMEGTIVGALSFSSFSSQRRWSLGLVSRLRLAGEILALGIRRHQYAQGLRDIAVTMEKVSPDHAGPEKVAARHFRDRALRLMQAEHQERRRMGQVLHEDVMQILAAVAMYVGPCTKGAPQSPHNTKALTLLKEAVQKLRDLTLELRPEAVDEMTLAAGIHWLVGQMRRRYDMEVDVRIDETVGPVADDIRNFLYDSIRKLLENVAVRSSCNRATIEIQGSDPSHIQFTVSDEGVGFNPASLQGLPSAGFGLFSIREQAELLGGTLEVTSSLGRGTRVAVTVPSGDEAVSAECGT